jgi:hypothetical protein
MDGCVIRVILQHDKAPYRYRQIVQSSHPKYHDVPVFYLSYLWRPHTIPRTISSTRPPLVITAAYSLSRSHPLHHSSYHHEASTSHLRVFSSLEKPDRGEVDRAEYLMSYDCQRRNNDIASIAFGGRDFDRQSVRCESVVYREVTFGRNVWRYQPVIILERWRCLVDALSFFVLDVTPKVTEIDKSM